MENKVTPSALTWLKLDQAPPLPEDREAKAADTMTQILTGFPVRTQMAILSVNLFRLVRREQDVKLLSLFTRNLKGRFEKWSKHADYAAGVSASGGHRPAKSAA